MIQVPIWIQILWWAGIYLVMPPQACFAMVIFWLFLVPLPMKWTTRPVREWWMLSWFEGKVLQWIVKIFLRRRLTLMFNSDSIILTHSK